MKIRIFSIAVSIALVCLASQCQARQGFDISDFDVDTRAQDDLFEHVNGTWLRETEIPADKSSYGSFGKLADLSQLRIRKIVERVSNEDHPVGSEAQKIGDFYRSFMNEGKVNSLGAAPIIAELESIKQIKDKATVFEYFATAGKHGISSPIGMAVGQDPGNAQQYIVQLVQSGTSLPDRDYYLKNDPASEKSRQSLVAYIERLFELVGDEENKGLANEILAFETALAAVQWTRVERRDAKKSYNKMSLEKLVELTDNKIDWRKYFQISGIAQTPNEVNVRTPSFFTRMVSAVESTDLAVLKAYLQFQLIDSAAPVLSSPFVDANFELYQKQLAGVDQQRPRWKRGVNIVAGGGRGFGALGEAVGKLYVAEHFKPEAKAEMEKLVDNLTVAFGNGIDNLTWMTSQTKSQAKEKLSKFTAKIGYPNRWRDYSTLNVDPGDLYGNVVRSRLVEHERNIAKLGKPIDREEWAMTPQTVNAYYNPSKNEIVFPAAILQPPFFDLGAPEALNYGGIGAVIGHEISHGFDDQGSKYDGNGNLRDWWTDEDRQAFGKLTGQLVKQFSQYSPLPGKSVNGELTLGENIADLSGLEVSHRALTIALENTKPIQVAGWNSDQLFFVGWSRVWQRKYKDKEMVRRLLTDPHSPSRYRANGPVTNIEAFYKAFDVQPGDNLFKPESERIKIW